MQLLDSIKSDCDANVTELSVVELNVGCNRTLNSKSKAVWAQVDDSASVTDYVQAKVRVFMLDHGVRVTSYTSAHMFRTAIDKETQEDTIKMAMWFMRIDTPKLIKALYALAIDLDQDYIAVYWPFLKGGRLVGPKAEQWGEFNKQFFRRY